MILSLFSFVRANDNSSTVEWSPAQFEELQLQVKLHKKIYQVVLLVKVSIHLLT